MTNNESSTTLTPTSSSRIGVAKSEGFCRWQWQIFTITWIAYAGYYFTRESFAVAKLGILNDPIVGMSLPKENLALVDSAYLVFDMIGQFTWGSISDRFGT